MSKICYGLAGSNGIVLSLPNYGPCNLQAGNISLCCEVGQTCLTNGLCMTQSGSFYTGGCTDTTYQAAICPKFCISGDAHSVVRCPFVKGGDFCCSVNETNKTCCETASNGLGLNDPVVSAQAVSAIGTSNVPASTSTSATRTSSADSSGHTRFPKGKFTPTGKNSPNELEPTLGTKIRATGVLIFFLILCFVISSSCWRSRRSRRGHNGPRPTIFAAIRERFQGPPQEPPEGPCDACAARAALLQRRPEIDTANTQGPPAEPCVACVARAARLRRRAETNTANNIELDDLRAPHDNQAPPTQGTIPVEAAEGSEANAAEPDADPTQTPPPRPQNPLAPPPYAFARPPRDGTVDHRRARVRPGSADDTNLGRS